MELIGYDYPMVQIFNPFVDVPHVVQYNRVLAT